MNWQEVCADTHLRNLPFKIELNEYGQVVMSPVKVYHSAFQGEIEYRLRFLLPHGRTLPECAIATPKGTKAADVAWISPERFQIVREEDECSIAPEICVEVISSSNSKREISEKITLYFNQGALECWTCDEDGNMQFYAPSGPLEKSVLAPDFPVRVDL
ncbi:MAG: Uma2 family endonuclease [Candidatus Competibacteraceae bacterium]|nr:Uma2 family endonuclease [Candidatus Competibacteraceae bacterium]MCP5126224.1 Uma2 family endonuclease [Gammaproteobacteria bacterium]HRX70046.1 Uma2 family endonuclease [Candidatus Competibacteraceae bacterium]